MRTGHARLNNHLHRISKANSLKCPYRPRRLETVPHFLLERPQNKNANGRLRRKLHRKARSSLFCLLAEPPRTKPTLAFIQATHRLKQTHGDLTPPRDDRLAAVPEPNHHRPHPLGDPPGHSDPENGRTYACIRHGHLHDRSYNVKPFFFAFWLLFFLNILYVTHSPLRQGLRFELETT